MREPKPKSCEFCMGIGYRGMDTCGKCRGTGSLLWVGAYHFPNTEEGWDRAMKKIEEMSK